MDTAKLIAGTSIDIAEQGSVKETGQESGAYRVRFFGLGDLSYHWQLERIEKLFLTNEEYRIVTIDDAIEARECLLVLEVALTEEAKRAERFMMFQERATLATRGAYRYMKSRLAQDNLTALYEEVCIWYKEAFLRFLSSSGLDKEIAAKDFAQFLHTYPAALQHVLTQRKMVAKFGPALREAMLAYPNYSAELIISSLASSSDRVKASFHFPSSVTNDDVDSIFCAYAVHDYANPNYLKAITQWRTDWGYAISSETKTAALERYQSENRKALEGGTTHGCSYGLIVGFSPRQIECVKAGMKDDDLTFLFSGRWVEKYHDHPTLLNNFIYMFGFISTHGLLEAGKPDHARSVLLDLIGVKTKNEYREGIGQALNRMREVGVVHAYREFLGDNNIKLEDLVEWFFNSYIVAEYSIDGFHVEIERGGSFLSRCRSIGPEIEKALKMYQLYSKGRMITKEALRFERFSSFQGLSSRVQNKYAYGAGEEFEIACSLLLSDQCMLSYSPTESKSHDNFLDRLREEDVTRAEIGAYCFNQLDWLIEKGFIIEDPSTGLILPTNKTHVTHRIWRDGCIAYQKAKKGLRCMVDELVDEGYLKFESTLLTKGEASCFSYVFHNHDYVDALALRNKYLHGESFDGDANSETHKINYGLFLRLFIQLILKLDDEFSQAKPSDCKIEFVDWPMYEVEDDFRRVFNVNND